MVSQKNSGHGQRAASGTHAKQRHMRDSRGNVHDMSFQPPKGLKAELDKPLLSSSKHKHFMIQVENKDKKDKKLEYLHTRDRNQPGMEFIPIGNPALTAKCKDISREHGAAIYIVSPAYRQGVEDLTVHTNRIGYQFRQWIVDMARKELNISKTSMFNSSAPGVPEPIPATQAEINEQADIAIKDLFPRIPNFDRRTIIDRAFNLSSLRPNKDRPVGLAPEVTLARRVQLAVLAHIRHCHTRYDNLLVEEGWPIARKVTEDLCLQTLIKWRGDEENGRDQEDAILRELVVISDTDDSDDDGDGDDSEDEDETSGAWSPRGVSGRGMDDVDLSRPARPPTRQRTAPLSATHPPEDDGLQQQSRTIRKVAKRPGKPKTKAKKNQRGFKRYLEAQALWEEAVERERREAEPRPSVAMNRSASHGSRPRLPTEPAPTPSLRVRHMSPASYRILDAQVRSRERGSVRGGEREGERERLHYGDATQGTLPSKHYLAGELGPMDRSQPPHHVGTWVERVRHQDQDLRDHLVKSIESPELPAFRPRPPPGPSSWEQRRDVDLRSAAPMVTYDRAPAPSMPTGSRPLYHDPVGPPRNDLVLLAPRSQAHRAMADTGSYPQSTIPATPLPRGVGRIFTAPAAIPTRGLHSFGYRESMTTAPNGSSHGSEYRAIPAHDDHAPLRSRVRPIMVGETHSQARRVMVDLTDDSPEPPQRQHPVMRSATQMRHPDSEYLIGHGQRAWNEGHRVGQSAHDTSQDVIQIIHVSDRFPRRHEPQSAPAEPAQYELHPSTPRYRDQERGFDGPGRYEPHPQHAVQYGRIEHVVARLQEPLRGYHYQSQSDAMRQPGVPMNAHRQERVVGLQYVSTAPNRGTHSFASPPGMGSNEGRHWSRPASVASAFPDQNQRPPPGQHYTREDGVIVLN